MATRKIEVAITGDARSLERAFRRSARSGDDFGKRIGRGAGKGMLLLGGATAAAAIAGVAGIGLGLVKAGKAAAEAEASNARLAAQLTTLGKNTVQVRQQIDDTVQSLSMMSAFDDEDLQDAFSALVRSSGNVAKSQKDLALVTDIARGAQMDLGAAAKLVNKVNAGSVSSLKRYGIIIDKNATKEEAIAALRKKFAGQAEAYGNTAAGAQEKIGVALENAFEQVGVALTPVIVSLSNIAVKYLPAIAASATKYVTKAKDLIIEFVNAFRDADGLKGKAEFVLNLSKDALEALTKNISTAMSGVDWSVVGEAIGNGISSGIKITNEAVNKMIQTFAKYAVANSGPLADAGTLILADMIISILDPEFWLKHWKTGLALALAVFPAGKVIKIGAAFVKFFGRPILKLADVVLPSIVRLADDALGAVANLVRRFGVQAVFGLNDMLTGIRRSFFNQLTALTYRFQSFIQNTVLVGIFEGLFKSIGPMIEKIIGGIFLMATKIRSVISGLAWFLEDTGSKLLLPISRALFKIGDTIEKYVIAPANRMGEEFGGGAHSVLNAIFILVDGAIGAFARFSRFVLYALEMPVKFMQDKFVGAFLTGILRVASTIENARTLIGTAASTMGSAVLTGLQKAWAYLPGILQKLIKLYIANVIVNAAADVITSAFQLGASIVNGISSGISNAAYKVKDVLLRAVKDPIEWAKKILGIASPSKVTANEIGEPLVDGVLWGIKNKKASLVKGFRVVLEDAVRSARDNLGSLTSGLGGMLGRVSAASIAGMTSTGTLTSGMTLVQIRAQQDKTARERDKQRLEDAVANAESDEGKKQAQQELDDWLLDEEARMLEESMTQKEKSYDEDINNLKELFDRGIINAEEFRTRLSAIVGGETGSLLGTEFATMFSQQLAAVFAQITQLAAYGGIGLDTPTVVSPSAIATGEIAAGNKKRFDDASAAWDKRRVAYRNSLENAKNKDGKKKYTAKQIDAMMASWREDHPVPKRADYGLAMGGVLKRATFVAGEAGPEAVIPLSNPRAQRSLAAALAGADRINGGGTTVVNVTVNGNEFSAKDFARKLKPELDRVVGFGQV